MVIDESEQLNAFAAELSRADWLVLDTEADSLHAYPEKLCLLQFGLPGRLELVDPLAGVDLRPLFGALAERELVMHGSDYDVRLLRAGHVLAPPTTFPFPTRSALRDPRNVSRPRRPEPASNR